MRWDLFSIPYQFHYRCFQNIFISKALCNIHQIPAFLTGGLAIFSRMKRQALRPFLNLVYLVMLFLPGPSVIHSVREYVRRVQRTRGYVGQFHIPFAVLGLFLFFMNTFIFAFSLRDGLLPGFFGHRSYITSFKRTILLTHPLFFKYFYRIRRARWRFRVVTSFRFAATTRRGLAGTFLNDLVRFFNVPIRRRVPLYSFDWIRYMLYSHKGWRVP